MLENHEALEALKTSIIQKCGYSINHQEGEKEESEEWGYYWEDSKTISDYFEEEKEAIADCLKNLDSTGIELTTEESKFLSSYQTS